MADRLEISDEEWGVIYPILVANKYVRIGTEKNAVPFWWRCCGFSGRERSGVYSLPFMAGGIPYSNGFPAGVNTGSGRRYIRDASIFLIYKPYSLIPQSTVRIPARRDAAGNNAEDEALGRSRGGFSTKIHAITDALGNPLDFVLTGGQASDVKQAEPLLALTPEGTQAFCGDKGYDSDALVQAIEALEMEAVIPPCSNRTEPRECNWFIYTERHLIECFFNKINLSCYLFSI
ncbi:transposase [Gammaproteobacteria bacterium]